MLLRYVVVDDPKKYEEVASFFEAVSQGKVIPYLSSVVLMEAGFILKSFYKKDKGVIVEVIKKFSRMRGVVIVDKTDLKLALRYLDKYKVKFSDCLIASSISKGVKVFSYDDDFRKMKLDLINPKGFQ